MFVTALDTRPSTHTFAKAIQSRGRARRQLGLALWYPSYSPGRGLGAGRSFKMCGEGKGGAGSQAWSGPGATAGQEAWQAA